LREVTYRVHAALMTAVALGAAACGGTSESKPPADPPPVVSERGAPPRDPAGPYNACERIWCLTHEANYDLGHFLTGHVGWILHDDGHGDVFVPRYRSTGPAFPHARENVLLLCGAHVHPYWLSGRRGPVTRTGYNVALGYPRAHFATYGTRVPPCCLNEEGWGFLHASAPREYRFGDRTTAGEMAGAGWQKAIVTRRDP
jgi:hypothetical protein